MIKSWKNSTTRQLAETGKSKFSGLDAGKAQTRLSALDDASALSDFKNISSVGLHKLTGDRKGQWAIKVNGPWRICFIFKAGDAYDVEITDYH